MNNKIALVFPYFGKFPDWMDLFVYSCKQNSFIDFIFFTDCDFSQLAQSENIIYHSISFESYCALVSDKLKIKFHPDSPYKLCDLRPFYGVIHEDILKRYDFFGFGDIDLVYGDLQKFINKKILSNYDLISTHGDRVSGHFFLMRNSKHFRELCFKINNWENLLVDDEHKGLDENNFSDVIKPHMQYVRLIYACVLLPIFGKKQSFNIYNLFVVPISKILFNYKGSRMFFKEMETTPRINQNRLMKYVYKNGSVFKADTGKEIPYLHFLFFKKNRYDSDFLWDDNAYLKIEKLALLDSTVVLIDKLGIKIDIVE